MSTFSYKIVENIESFDEIEYQVNRIVITHVDGKFLRTSGKFFVRIFDNTNSVTAFSTYLTGNQKELITLFTTDAFAIFTGLVDIEFGINGIVESLFTSVDIPSEIESLSPIQSILSAPMADNAWLASL